MAAEQQPQQKVTAKEIAEMPQKLRGFVGTADGGYMYYPVGVPTALTPEFQQEQRPVIDEKAQRIVTQG